MAAKLDQAGLVQMQRERKLLYPYAQCVPEASGVGLVLETDDEVVGVPHNDHIALGLAPSPAVGPQIEHVVHIDVGEQRRNYRALSRSHLTYRDDPVLQDTRLQPFADETDDALVADAVLHEPDQPILADRIEEGRHIGIENEVHTSGRDSDY